MKNYIVVLSTILLLIVLIKCENDSENDNSDQKLTYVTTILGGCNGKDLGNLKSLSVDEKDTVIFSVENDTIDVFVGVNYVCCAPFTSSAVVLNDSIIINLTDICSGPSSCYCYCNCFYTWNFLFTNFVEKKYYFKIVLHNPQQASPIILKEGSVMFIKEK